MTAVIAALYTIFKPSKISLTDAGIDSDSNRIRNKIIITDEVNLFFSSNEYSSIFYKFFSTKYSTVFMQDVNNDSLRIFL